MKIMQSLSKLRFCLHSSRDIFTAIKLMYQSKKFTHLYRNHFVRNSYDDCILYKLHFFKKDIDVYARTGTGDIMMFYEIFWSKMYEIPTGLLLSPGNIIDLGANVGFTTMYFALKYPGARIISLEPSKMNFEVLLRNVRQFENVSVINAAAWFETKKILFKEAGFAYNSKIDEQASVSGYMVDAYCITDILNRVEMENIDLLKIDIEGAEQILLQKNAGWLKKVNNIIIEIHHPYTFLELQANLSVFGFKIIKPPAEGLKMLFATRV